MDNKNYLYKFRGKDGRTYYMHECVYCKKSFARKMPTQKYCSNECRYKGLKPSIWTKKEVILQIKKLYNDGIDLNAVNIRDNFLPLFKGALRQYKSWKNAINATGLKYSSIRKDRKTESYKGLVFQKVLMQIFQALNLPYKQGKTLTYGKKGKKEWCNPDFISKNNLKWTDAKMRSWTVGTEETIKKYLKHIPKVEIFYIGGGTRLWQSKRVKFICVKKYYKQLKEIGRQDLINKINYLEKEKHDKERFKIWSEKWSKDRIIRQIKKLYKSGIPLNDDYVAKHYSTLRGAAASKRYFGSWKKAIEATGLNYDRLMKRHNYPTRKELINTFLELENKGKLNWNFIYDENMHLYNAARILFGSLQKAVEAAGLDYNQCLSHQKWSKEKIIRELKELHKKNVRLSSNVLRKINPALEGVIESKRYFNSQQEARKAAGIPEDEYKREKWSKEKIIIELKNLHRKNIYMSADNIIKLNPNLSSAIKGKRYFKSLKEARKAAGINFVVISQRKWTDEKIINEIKKLHKKGIRITSKEIKPINAGLVSVIEKYMKSWESARKAAGVSLKKKQ